MKKTLVIGASTNPERYAYKAAKMLMAYGHEVVLQGIKADVLDGVAIDTDKKLYDSIDTVTLYVGPKNQQDWLDYIRSLQPKRVIFNPGTENEEFEMSLEQQGVETLEACTLVLLSTGQY